MQPGSARPWIPPGRPGRPQIPGDRLRRRPLDATAATGSTGSTGSGSAGLGAGLGRGRRSRTAAGAPARDATDRLQRGFDVQEPVPRTRSSAPAARVARLSPGP